MGRTLSELSASISLAEFLEHWDDFNRSPWGEARADIHAALISQTVANYAGMSRKKPAKLDEFLLKFEREEEPQDEPDPLAHFRSIGG